MPCVPEFRLLKREHFLRRYPVALVRLRGRWSHEFVAAESSTRRVRRTVARSERSELRDLNIQAFKPRKGRRKAGTPKHPCRLRQRGRRPSPLFRGSRFFCRFPGVLLRVTPGYTPLHLRCFPRRKIPAGSATPLYKRGEGALITALRGRRLQRDRRRFRCSLPRAARCKGPAAVSPLCRTLECLSAPNPRQSARPP